MARPGQELDPIPLSGSDDPARLPNWVGTVGLVGAAGVLLIGIGLFSESEPTNQIAGGGTADPSTTTTTMAPVFFPQVLAAGPAGVTLPSGSLLFDGCAEVAFDDMAGGLVVEECDGPIIHFSSNGERRSIASAEFDLEFVDALSSPGRPSMVALRHDDDGLDVVAYHLADQITEQAVIPDVTWWSAAPGAQAVVGFDFENNEPAPGCMEIRRGTGPGEVKLIGCADGDPAVLAASIDEQGQRVAYVALNDLDAYVLTVVDLPDDEVVASVRIDLEPVWLDFNGQFVAVTARSGGGTLESVVIDTETYAKQQYAGLVTFVRRPVLIAPVVSDG